MNSFKDHKTYAAFSAEFRLKSHDKIEVFATI